MKDKELISPYRPYFQGNPSKIIVKLPPVSEIPAGYRDSNPALFKERLSTMSKNNLRGIWE